MEWSITAWAPSSVTHFALSGREAVPITVRSVSWRANCTASEPTPPAAPMISSLPPPVFGTSSRSNSASHAVTAVSGSAAASGEAKAFRLQADDALIHQMIFGIGARPHQRAGIEHLVARLEEGDVRTHRLDHPGGVPAEDHRRIRRALPAHAHLGVHRIDRDRLHIDQQVARAGRGLGGLEVEQRLLLGDGQRSDIADGFHGTGLRRPMARVAAFPPNVGRRGNFRKTARFCRVVSGMEPGLLCVPASFEAGFSRAPQDEVGLQRSTLILRCSRSEPRRMLKQSATQARSHISHAAPNISRLARRRPPWPSVTRIIAAAPAARSRRAWRSSAPNGRAAPSSICSTASCASANCAGACRTSPSASSPRPCASWRPTASSPAASIPPCCRRSAIA